MRDLDQFKEVRAKPYINIQGVEYKETMEAVVGCNDIRLRYIHLSQKDHSIPARPEYA